MNRVAFLMLGLVVLAGCEGECFDDNPDNDTGTSCDTGDGSDARGEAWKVVGLAGARDRFTAFVRYHDYRTSDRHVSLQLVDLDPAGQILAVADTPLADWIGVNATGLATDGRGAVAAAAYQRVQWFRGDERVANADLGADTALAFHGGAYWFAIASSPRQLARFDTDGARLETIVLPSPAASPLQPSLPSIASDPIGDELAAGWLANGALASTVVVDRVRDGVAETFELAQLANRPWTSSVAIHGGTIAILYGEDERTPQIALIAPDDRVTIRRIDLPLACRPAAGGETPLVGTASGYAVRCGDQLVVFDTAGTVVSTLTVAATARLASGATGALALYEQDRAVLVHSIGSDVEPPVELFRGYDRDSGGSPLGCNAVAGSSFALALAVLPLVMRRRRRATIAEPSR